MKKIVLSLFVLIMAISVTVVYAEETTGNIVSLHEDAYSSVNDITWTSHTNNLFDYMTASVDSEGNYVLTQTKTSGTGKSVQLAVTRPVGEVVIAKDDVNRTEVVTNNLNGKYVFEFDIESLVKQYPNTTAPYYAIELYSGTSSVIIVRIRANSLDVLDNSSQASATYNYSVSHSSASSEPAEFNLKLEIDTVNKTLSSYYNDKLISSKADCPIAVGKPVDTIRFFGLSRIDEGSYVKIKNFKITQKERATNTTLSSLPEKLVNDVEQVTETSVTLPVIEGVTWASADTSAATINGNTLNFNIPETGTKEAVVTATFAQDGYEYTKTYKMTMGKEVVYEFSYTVSDGKVTITDLPSDFAGSVVIPDTIDGYPVTRIGNSAFGGCTGLTEITIPDSVTSIERYAFDGCTSLTEITIPDSVTTIGSYAYYNTAYYKNSKNWENDVLYIGKHLIMAKIGLTGAYNVKEGTLTIADEAFENCTGLTEITIPNSVTSIGSDAFYGCNNLKVAWYLGSKEQWDNVSNGSYNSALTDVIVCKGGSCGENLEWAYSDGVLTISGSGDMADWSSSSSVPWYNAFGKITKVIIEDGVTGIGDYAFYDCTSLTDVTIPNSVTSIGDSAFWGCKGLTEVTIGNGATSIGSFAFAYCTSLTEITIPNSVTTIGRSAFRSCTGLTEITIPNSVTTIGDWAFENCTGLTEVTIGNGVTSIGDYAFEECKSLTAITIGNGVTSIGDDAFAYCTSLTEITIPDSVTSIGSDTFYKCTGLTEITIPDGVTSIGRFAFYGCTSLTDVTIPNSVTSIGRYAFDGCTSLTEITIGNGVTSIGSSAFRDCTSLTKVNITDLKAWCGITFETSTANPLCYAGNLYINNTLVTELVIPEGVTSIGDYAFRGCTSLTEITIPNSVISIGSDAFYGCSNLKTAWYHGSKEQWDNVSIGSYNSALTDVIVCKGGSCGENLTWAYSDGVLTISGSGDMADWSSSSSVPWYNAFGKITKVIIEDGVTGIGDYAFYGCTSLTDVTIPNSVTSIGSDAFYGCTGLTEITIPDSVTSIGNYAFGGCKGLTEITIPDSVISIGDYAFYGCTSLKEITIGNGVTSIGSDAFYNCSNLKVAWYAGSKEQWNNVSIGSYNSDLTNVIVYKAEPCGENLEWAYSDGVLTISGSGKMNDWSSSSRVPWYKGCKSITKVIIEDGVTGIGNSAFRDCTRLTDITIPNSVTSIGYSAFYGCTGLTEVTIGNGVTSIGENAFSDCTSLTEITIGNGVTSIGDSAFYGCTGLTEITIPEGVTSIGNYAFRGCTSLTDVTIPEGVTSIGNYAFYKCTGITKVNITDLKAWCGITFETSDANPLCYAGNLYINNTLITELVIPEVVTSIGNYAFYGCNSFRAVIIPNSVTSIGRYAFEYCRNLKTTWYLGSKEQWDNVSVGSNNSALTNAVVYKGEPCGENLEWAYSDGVLTISGSGKMNDWSSSSSVPWYKGCESITKLIIEDGVTSIGYSAFYGCTGLTEVTIPDSVTSIGYCAFEGCTSLTEITIPNSVTSIGNYAFEDCTSLIEITIPDGVTSIGEGAFYNTAYYNNSEIWENGVLYIGKHLIKANEEVAGAYNIKEGTLTIADYAFAGCTSLTELTIPNSVTSIGDLAFNKCTGLTKVNITDLKAWCEMDFGDIPLYYAGNLYVNNTLVTELVIPDGITGIGSYAFAYCKSLTKVVIPDSVTHIGRYAFYNCTGLEEITLPFVGTESATDKAYEAVLGVIFGGGDDCYVANQQISSQEIRSFKIPNSLKKVTITNQKVIPYGAFSGCIGLEEIVLSENVEEVSTNVFLNCDNLELAVFNNKDTKIARTNFVGCDIAKISGYTDSTAEKFANAYLFEFVPLSEQTNEFEILCKNLVQGTSDITMDICVTSPTEPEGKIYVALYDEEHMLQVKVYDAKEIVNAKLDFAEGEYIKIMWWDSEYKPIIENLKIDL